MWSASSLNGGLILYLNWNTNIQSHAFQINTNIMSLKLVICHPDQSFVKQTKSCTSFPLYYRTYPTIQPSERTDWSVVCQPSSIRRQSSTNRRTVARITGELVDCVDRLQSHWGTNWSSRLESSTVFRKSLIGCDVSPEFLLIDTLPQYVCFLPSLQKDG